MKGFTLIELIVVMIITGILAVTAIPRFVGRAGFDARGFSDEAQAMLRYGQKVAVAQRTSVFVSLTGTTLALCYNAACTSHVLNPADKAAFSKNVPSGLTATLSTSPFSFDALGRPNPDAAVTLTVSATGEPTRTITVERETGYVHQ